MTCVRVAASFLSVSISARSVRMRVCNSLSRDVRGHGAAHHEDGSGGCVVTAQPASKAAMVATSRNSGKSLRLQGRGSIRSSSVGVPRLGKGPAPTRRTSPVVIVEPPGRQEL